ncbi:glycosyltransferase family 4 protein [Cnuibacter sp. UC19_7]|uniref:glycosyltransferase family 4 protein n=1 Tax=Cnuibacter sp. UC19_7 TaxID=3350166 RepID=UPI003670DC75
MKLLFDGFWWMTGPPSGRHVLRSLVKQWSESFPQDVINVRVPKEHLASVSNELSARSNVTAVPTRLPNHQLSCIAMGGSYDAIITQNFAALRRSRAVTAVLVHDAIFVEHPEWFTRMERAYLSSVIPLARRSDVVFTSSRAEALRIEKISKRKVHDVGLALPAEFKLAPSSKPGAEIPPRFVLAVGRLNARKNLEMLVRATSPAYQGGTALPLVVVGERNGRTESRDEEARHVTWLGGVSDGELKWLYAHCAAFVFPSLDEGFGLPILEAASEGARLALSEIGAFKELAPESSFFDPTDPVAMATSISRAMSAAPTPVHQPGWNEVCARMRTAILEESREHLH